MQTTRFLPILILILALAGFIAMKKTKPVPAAAAKTERIWRVNAITVSSQTRSPEVSLYGRVETPRKAELKSALTADVLSVKVREGEQVEKNDVLVMLDDADVQLELQQHQADLAEIEALINSERDRFERDKSLLRQEKSLLELADRAVKRAQKLEKTRLASQSSLDDAIAAMQRQALTVKRLEFDISDHPARLAQLEAKKKKIQAFIHQTQLDLKRTQISAPFAGRVARVDIAEGDRVRSGDSLLLIYDFNALEVRAQIPSRYRQDIMTSLANNILLPASANIDGQPYHFSLHRLSGEIQMNSGGVDGFFTIKEHARALRLGQFVQLTLTLPPREHVFAIPYTALYGLDHVYIVKEGYMQSVTIERVGEITEHGGKKRLLVYSDQLHDGDRVVSTQLPNAITGLRVEVVDD